MKTTLPRCSRYEIFHAFPLDVGEAAGITISDDQAEILDTPEKIVEPNAKS
jgi:hypothetical protein